MKIMQTIDNEHGNERPDWIDYRTRGQPDRRKSADDRKLRKGIISGVAAYEPIQHLDQPPGQRRQLVVAELPFAAIGQGLDEIEWQGWYKEGRHGGPDEKKEGEKNGESPLRGTLDRADQSRHRCRRSRRSRICRTPDAVRRH